MASIEKMTIRGIRSFSPNREETIEFYSPLTMIVGANGCGKTTVIEALKYACTGSLPPGARNGQSFVNDPAITDTTEVKANIKLRFRNRAGFSSVVTRSMQVLKKRTKLEFKALDGVFKTLNAQNEKVSTSQKCSDLDRMVPDLLGVSAPILENVIFCHQEESSWPMQEGMVLKKKFDDVFESTRYAKALDALVKARKEFSDKAKELKVDLAELGAHVQGANDAKRELAACEENQEQCQRELDSSEEKITRVEDKIRRHQDLVASAQETVRELNELRRRVSESERRLSDKQSVIGTPMNESDAELQELLNNFDAIMTSRRAEKATLKRSVDAIEREIAQLRSSTDDLNVRKGQGESLKQSFQEMQIKFLADATNICRQLEVTTPTASYTPLGARKCLQTIVVKIDEMQREIDGAVRKFKDVVTKLEKEHMDARAEISKLDIEISSKREELNKIVVDGDRRQAELTQYSGARNGLQMAEREYDEVKRNHDDFMETYQNKLADQKKSLKEISDEIRTLSELAASDAALLSQLNLDRQEIASIAATEKQLELDHETILADVVAAFATHRDPLSRAPAPQSIEELADIIARNNQSVVEKRKQLSAMKENLSRLRSDTAGARALLRQEKESLSEMQERLAVLRGDQVRGVSECVAGINKLRRCEVLQAEYDDREDLVASELSLEDLVREAEETDELACNYKSTFEAGQTFVKRLEKARRKINGGCPCCHQTISEEVAVVYNSNIRKLFQMKALAGTENDYLMAVAEAKSLVSRAKQLERTLQPLFKVPADIEATRIRIAELSPRVESLVQQEEGLNSSVSDLETLISSQDRACGVLNDLRVRWFAANQRLEDLHNRKRRHSQTIQSTGLTQTSDIKSIEALEEIQRQRSDRKDELLAKKDRVVAEESTLTKKYYHLKSQLADADKVIISARQRSAKQMELETMMKNRSGDIERLETEIRSIAVRRDESLRLLSQSDIALKSAKLDLANAEQAGMARMNDIRSKKDSLQRLIDALDTTEKKLTDISLADITARLDSIQGNIATKEENIRVTNTQITSISSELSSQENHRRSVRDNLDFRSYQRELQTTSSELRILEARSGSRLTDLSVAEREIERGEQEKRRLTSDRDKLEGNLQIYKRQTDELHQKLQNSVYRGIEERFRKKSIQYETTLLAAADLASYYDALDKALQNFHLLKIREINKIIKELWQLIYKGHDIDMIELESGQESSDSGGAGGASGVGKGRRSYHYRVVMRKGDAPLDMRGRCSAGQRVLAAIVIRLALAETFCLNCGILALDEPTTNLDDANKAGLAHALARIIISRSKQLNFQLICITHDEDFVRMMSTELAGSSDFSLPEYYFRVSREEDDGEGGGAVAVRGKHTANPGRFFSRIERIPWDDM